VRFLKLGAQQSGQQRRGGVYCLLHATDGAAQFFLKRRAVIFVPARFIIEET
jgi:hypothetical protein